jgi:preprotein translocase subunit SecA
MLWSTLRTRRRHVEPLRGLDAMAHRWVSRAKHSRIGPAYLRREAQAIVALESQYAAMSDEALDARIVELRDVFARRTHKGPEIRAGLAAIREVAKRETGEKPYPVQIMGALGLFHGQIVEMVTGEGKTLTAAVASTLLGWLRKPVHVITVNDYLAQRDADSRQPIFRRCGLKAGAVTGETQEGMRSHIYRMPIVYITQKELVADWLRDQLRLGRIADPVSTRWRHSGGPGGGGMSADHLLVPGLHIAVIDEVDAVLIDEAVTPLIIAQPRQEDAQSAMYERARDLAGELTIGADFNVEPAQRRVRLTDRGRDRLTALLKPDEHAIWKATRRREELVEQALVAAYCYHDRQHYQIVEGHIVIVDEYTGRFMQDRQWQHGLHQAVEAKEKLEITADRDTLASLSFQRFFMQYPHLSGMTGTAADARAEMETTYGLPVRIIPTNRPLQRKQLPALIYVSAELKWKAVVDEIDQMHRQGRPVLVGTRSVDASELLSSLLASRNMPHQVLNAVHHKAEAQIVAGAGEPGAITVATNMAGRGTDIKLGPGVAQRGGLHVILTERYTARRVDRQLAGRAGRQGDPGSARVIISLEDDLIIKFAGRVGAALRARYGSFKRPLPGWIMRVFDVAQRRAQQRAFQSRVNVLRHDEDLDRALPR